MTQAILIHYRRRARAFTLLELLIVIGIIALLIALATFGFMTVGRLSQEKATNNALENCKGLVTEYETTGSLDSLLTPLPVTTVTTPATLTDRWVGVPAPAVTRMSTAQMSAKSSFAAEETARIIQRLRTAPKNRESLEKMGANQIKAQPFQAVVVTGVLPNGTLPAGTSSILIDAIGDPIVFVPGGGLLDVNVGYDGKGPRDVSTSYTNFGQTIRSPDGRPFWASAGPDGDLTAGDDNLYSFTQ